MDNYNLLICIFHKGSKEFHPVLGESDFVCVLSDSFVYGRFIGVYTMAIQVLRPGEACIFIER